MARLHQAKGFTRLDVLAAVLLGLFLLALAPVLGVRVRQDAGRTTCGAHLARIGKAMRVYAADYEGEFPHAGGRASTWGPVANWVAPDRFRAFGINRTDGSGGRASISSCFYLLVKYAGLAPGEFLCPGDTGASEFQLPAGTVPLNMELIDGWDFGPPTEAPRHCSYAYHVPFGLYALTTRSDPGMAVATDRNPWIKSPGFDARSFDGFRPDIDPWQGSAEQARQGNAPTHQGDGQNVLFVDGHVAFAQRAYCSLDDDNIYTVTDRPAAGQGSALGDPPVVKESLTPGYRRDSLLVHDSPTAWTPQRETVTQQAAEVDSNDLKQTVMVATLDERLPEHKNAVWCSTFQIAWDKMKKDIIREPIRVLGAQELADRLNRREFPTTDIEEKSYYATAGFVKDGILEEIQNQMAHRFPSEPVPAFDERYRTLPDVAVAYGYLNVDVGFAHPYYVNPAPFSFRNSDGICTDVTSFGPHAVIPDANLEQIRAQVEVLYYDYGQIHDTDQFAVDLCKHTQPYQVVLARIRRGETLGAALHRAQEKIAGFKNDRDYETLCRLRPRDTLIVPDITYKLTHHFRELLNRLLGNPGWRLHSFFEALQKIDFTLSRTGVILKSEARLAPASRLGRRRDEPRRLHFDRPFLIYVRKRAADATPFFVMWVDNAELMKTPSHGR